MEMVRSGHLVRFFAAVFLAGLVLSPWPGAHAILKSVSFGARTCTGTGAQEKCTTTMSANVVLSEREREFTATFAEYNSDDGQSYKLNHPISVHIMRKNTTVSFQTKFSNRLYNAYELFDPDPGCAVGMHIGKCFASQDKAPLASDNAQNFVLCCIDSARGTGTHCLRYNYSQPYDSYLIGNPTIVQEVAVDVTIDGTTRAFDLSSLYTTSEIAGFGSAMIIPAAQSDHSVVTRIASLFALMRDARNSSEDPRNPNLWFIVNKSNPMYIRFGVKADEWKREARCSNQLHFDTKTHTVDGFETDQFYVVRGDTFGGYLASRNAGSNVVVLGDLTSGPTLRATYVNPDNTEVVVQIENIS